jgi:uncharacterized protein (DUF1810 family)
MPPSHDSDELQRFLDAQEPVYPQVVAELRAGRKRSHWIWFIFPQIAGLGTSTTSQFYAIRSLGEAQAYLQHPVLGPRLRECTQLVVDVAGHEIGEILGYPDDLKFRSSMTLFDQAAPDEQLFAAALRKYFAGQPDLLTIKRLGL